MAAGCLKLPFTQYVQRGSGKLIRRRTLDRRYPHPARFID